MNWYISSMIFAWSWENCAISFTFTLLSFLFLFFRVLLHLRHLYEMWYLANTIYNILLLELYFIHPISTVEAPTAYSKYGPRSFLAYIADNLHHLYATGYSSYRLGFRSNLKTAIMARFLCNREKLSRADLESGSSHFDRFLCQLLARYEQM